MILHFRLLFAWSIGESLLRGWWPKHTTRKLERLKHVTNDSRWDLSFIIVSDTCCRHHRPLFCHLHTTTTIGCGTSRNLIPVFRTVQMHKSKQEAMPSNIFAVLEQSKENHISRRHKHVFNISACKHDELRFNQLWKCVHIVFTLIATSFQRIPGNNFPIKTFLAATNITANWKQ